MEQEAIYNQQIDSALINVSYTVAPDGGGASYVWIGGNDISEEGSWVWDGNNDGEGTPFCLGLQDGASVD